MTTNRHHYNFLTAKISQLLPPFSVIINRLTEQTFRNMLLFFTNLHNYLIINIIPLLHYPYFSALYIRSIYRHKMGYADALHKFPLSPTTPKTNHYP